MFPEVPIVDCGPFCAVGFSRTIDKSEFSHSLDSKQTFNVDVRQWCTIGAMLALVRITEASRNPR